MNQQMDSDNPFGDDDYFFSSEEEDGDQEYEKKIRDQLIATKPYEDSYAKFQEWYNDYFTKQVNFEDEKIQTSERNDDTILKVNNMVNVDNKGLFDLLNTENDEFSKIITTFSFLDTEVQNSKQLFEDNLFGALAMYGERPEEEDGKEIEDGEAENELARILDILRQTYEEVKKLMATAFNIINQMNALYSKKGSYYKNYKNIDLFSPLDTVGTIITMMYTLDQIITNNECLSEDWNQYKKMINIIQKEPSKFNVTNKQLRIMEKTLIKYEKSVMSGECTQGFLKQNWEIPPQYTANNKQYVPIYKNENLQNLFISYFKQRIVFFQEVLSSPTESDERQSYMNLLGVYSFYRKLFKNSEEKKIFKEIWNLQRKAPIIITSTHTICYVYKFLREICPLTKSATLDPKSPENYIQEYTMYIDSKITEQMKSLYSSFCTWLGRMESISTSNQDFEDSQNRGKQQINDMLNDRLQRRTKLIMSGLLIAHQVRLQVTNCLLLHLEEGLEIPPTILYPIRQGIEILQSIRYIFNSQQEAFHPSFFQRNLQVQLDQSLRQRLMLLRKQDSSNKKPEYNESIQSIQYMLRMIKYPLNQAHYSIINFLSQIPLQKKAFEVKEMNHIRYIVQKINTITRLQYNIEKATNCAFLFQGRDLIPILLQQAYHKPVIAKRLPFIFSAIEDTKILLKACVHLENKDDMYNWFKFHIIETFNNEYIEPTRKALEDFLRLNIHTMLIQQIENKNPYNEKVQQINRLLSVGKITIFEKVIDIRSEIQQHLNESFYNINVLNLHDMETYEEMRTLANHQFNLKLMHVYIPSQTIDQGSTKGQLDILEIIRNIPSFVQKFTYNLYSQTFIQITTDSKIVTTVGINQISDSIKTHGVGILNTTINSIYKYILKRITGFSQFLFDEMILSPLKKEQKWFKKNSEELNGQYPFKRADQFLKDIGRLGKFEDGSTYIDKFRTLITQIGNALGFVRLIRSASLNYSSESIEYLPSAINTEEDFQTMAKQALFGDTTVQAAQQLDNVFEYLLNSFSSRSDYLKVMVTSVQKKINIPENKHLKLFYQIVPILTINFLDSILMAKERLTKSNPFNAYFCDDGLVMGISYFLKLLNQNETFGSLHWKEEINEYFQEQKEQLKDDQEQDKKGKTLTETRKRRAEEKDYQRGLSLKKIESQIAEYDMFFYAFNTCQVLFRDDIA